MPQPETWLERAVRLLRDAVAHAQAHEAEEALTCTEEARESLMVDLGELPPLPGVNAVYTLERD